MRALTDRKHGGLLAAVLFSCVLGCAVGCSVRRGVEPRPAGSERPGLGDLTSAADRARLEVIAAARANASDDGSYRIGPDDLLDIRIPDLLEAQPQAASPRGAQGGAEVPAVSAAPAFQQGVRVTGAGEVSLPLLGMVEAKGLTPTELEHDIARRLVAADILRSPHVSVLVAEYRSRVVAVSGSVERPGLYPITKPGTTLTDILWAAGGPNRDAGRVVEFVPAADGSAGDRSPVRLDLELLLGLAGRDGRMPNPPARPGDVVSVAPAGSVLVDGWVEKPGSYPVTRGLTVSGALAAAGGQVFAADRRRATVKRVLGPGEDRSFTVDLDAVAHGVAADPPVVDGDVIRLPVSASRVVPWGMWTVAREMVHVGGNVLLF